jgi:hypothetical protein
VYWDGTNDLKAKVIVGLTQVVKRHPAVGWVRGDLVPDEASAKETLRLREQIDELKSALAKAETEPPSGSDALSQGDDPITIQYGVVIYSPSGLQRHEVPYQTTWNQIFSAIAPMMIHEAGELALRRTLDALGEHEASEEVRKRVESVRIRETRLSAEDFQTIKVQLRALRLMEESIKPRSLKDTDRYWKLTPFGDQTMTQLRAIKRPLKVVE